MEKIIYIVTSGSYSDYHICAVFDTEELAEKYCQFYNCYNPEESYKNYSIEEFTLNPAVTEIPKNLIPYRVAMTLEGEYSECRLSSYNMVTEKGGEIECWDAALPKISAYTGQVIPWNEKLESKQHIITFVLAKDETHAVKIVNEKRAQIVALNLWANNKTSCKSSYGRYVGSVTIK